MSVLLVVLVSILSQCAIGEKFTALKDMEKILHAEHVVSQDLRKYINLEENRLNKLKELADDYEKHSADALAAPHLHLGNPVNAFLLVKRFTTDWDHILSDLIKSNATEEFIEDLAYKTSLFPDSVDLSGAAAALMRLQDTYSLSTDKIARGDLQGVKRSPHLSANDCYELGRVAYNTGDYYHTIMWMEQALKLTDAISEPNLQEKAQLLDYLSYAAYMQGNLRTAYNLTIEWIKLEPNHIRAQNNLRYYEQMIQEAEAEKRRKGDEGSMEEEQFQNPKPHDDYRSSEEFVTYERLCRDEETHARPDKHKLHCLLRRHHPIFYIRPLKEEIMSFSPRILIYHDVITDSEISKVKELASPRLNRATVQNPQTGVLESANYRISKRYLFVRDLSPFYGAFSRHLLLLHRSGVFKLSSSESDSQSFNSKYRTSKSAWLRDGEDQLINSVSLKAGLMANLSLETVEELQVVNYGIGGHYEPHYDFARKRERSTFEEWRGNRVATVIYYKEEVSTFREEDGNRISTVIYYMTDVDAGGFTVFPAIGVKLKPEKGACAVWFNLLKSGEGDYDTRHAACPVLTGDKWVCNKWFHERGQELIRPCGPTEDE